MRPIDGIINVNHQFLDTQLMIIQTDKIKIRLLLSYALDLGHCAFNRHHDRFGVNHRRLASKIPTFAGIFHQSQSLYVQIETKQRRSQGDEDDGEAKKSRAKKHSNEENFI